MAPRHLDKKIKIIWFLPTALVILVLMLIIFLVLFFVEGDRFVFFGMDKITFLLAGFLLLIVLIGFPSYLWIHLEYISFTYELTEKELVIRQGILTRKTIVIPYEKIQNVNSTRTVLERLLGLATLTIETAGTNVGASEAFLPGITKKDILIKEIMGKVEQTKKEKNENQKVNNPEDLLNNILKELIRLNEKIDKIIEKKEEKGHHTKNFDFKNIKH
jgi:uncharacterized membrane protein YdbT with pleckstrin-like domain